jgi:hypothetical protein
MNASSSFEEENKNVREELSVLRDKIRKEARRIESYYPEARTREMAC